MTTLVLLPGMDGTGKMFEPFVSALGSEFGTIIVRYSGDRDLGYAELESVVRAALPKSGDYVIVAESFSGPIGISIAAAPPSGLKGLVLCASFARNPQSGLSWLRPLAELVPVRQLPAGLLSLFTLGGFSTPELRSLMKSALADVAPTVLGHRLRQVMDADVRSLLSKIKMPCLYLRATEDRLVPAVASELIANGLANSKIVDVHAPHFLLQAAPNEAAEAISTFVRTAVADTRN